MGEEIKKAAKAIGKAVFNKIKIPLIVIGGIIVAGVLILNVWFGFTAEAIETANGTGEIIKNAIEFKDGELTIKDEAYEAIKTKLSGGLLDPSKAYLLDNNDTLLKKMVQAEVVTNYPYTGKGSIQGVIHIRRGGISDDLKYLTRSDFTNKMQEAESRQDFSIVKPYFTINDSNMDIIVATYEKTTITDKDNNKTVSYKVTERNLQYWSQVTQYSMPFEFMYILLATTNNPKYVEAVADLAIKDTKINYTILDSNSTYTTTHEHLYDKETTTKNIEVKKSDGTETTTETKSTQKDILEKTTEEIETNSLTGEITYVKTWIYSKDNTVAENIIGPTTDTQDTSPNPNYESPVTGSRVLNSARSSTTSTFYTQKITQIKNIRDKIINTNKSSTWVSTPGTNSIDPSMFLGLWSNATGTYDSSNVQPFLSFENGGKKVEYPVYGKPLEKECPDKHITDSPNIFFYFLQRCERTQSYEILMRYVLQIYTGKDFGVTDEDLQNLLDIFGSSNFNNTFGTGLDFWWPIGSIETRVVDGITYADGTPESTTITSGVGPRWGKNHGGIDIAKGSVVPGPNIIASKSGTVEFATENGGIYGNGYYGSKDGGGYGNYVIIDHGNGEKTIYAHMAKGTITVKSGDKVKQGQLIGKMGTSGSSTGVHLHFEIRINGSKVDPEEYVSQSDPRPIGIAGGTIEEQVWFSLIKAGYTEYAVSGVLGNIYAESGFDPAIIEKGNGIGFGLCQWSFGRRTQLENFAKSRGKSPSDVYIQIEFLLGELTVGGGADGYASYQLLSYKGYNGDSWRKASSPENAATAFCWSFERPGTPNLTKRTTKAREYYNQFHGKTLSSSDSRIGTITLSGDNSVKMQNMLVEALRIADDDRYKYSQDRRYEEFYYDCSSFVSRLYKKFFEIDVGSTTDPISTKGQPYKVSLNVNNLKPGDILWRDGHVGIYLGNGQYVHASNPTNGILVSQFSNSSFTQAYRWIK